MSHPWKAQPYYLYRETRTTGMVPAPMGAFEVRTALSGFTRGSFASRSPWATPAYVRSVPDGVAGFRGFGEDAGCMPPAQAAQAVLPFVRQALNGLNGVGPQIGGQAIGSRLASIGDGPLLNLLTPAIKAAADYAREGIARFKAWLAPWLKQIVTSIVGTSVMSVADLALNNVNLDGEYDTNGIWNSIANKVGDFLFGKWPTMVCADAPGACATPEEHGAAGVPALCVGNKVNFSGLSVVLTAYDVDQIRTVGLAAWQKDKVAAIAKMSPQVREIQQRLAAQVAQASGSAVARATTAPKALTLLQPGQPGLQPEDTLPPGPAAAGGISPFVIAAGAVAALLLLK